MKSSVSKYIIGCEWHVNATLQRVNGFFYIRKLQNQHTCGVALRTTQNKRMSSNLIADLIVDNVRENMNTRPTEVVSDFRSSYGLAISYDQALLGVEKAKAMLFGDFSLSYDQLRWYVDAVNNTNAGSHIVLDCDQISNRFYRLFVSFKACIDGFNYCRPILFIDGTFLKGNYKGNILSAIGKDGNQGISFFVYNVFVLIKCYCLLSFFFCN